MQGWSREGRGVRGEMRGAWWAWAWPMVREGRVKVGLMMIRAKTSLLDLIIINPAFTLTGDEDGMGDGGMGMGRGGGQGEGGEGRGEGAWRAWAYLMARARARRAAWAWDVEVVKGGEGGEGRIEGGVVAMGVADGEGKEGRRWGR